MEDDAHHALHAEEDVEVQPGREPGHLAQPAPGQLRRTDPPAAAQLDLDRVVGWGEVRGLAGEPGRAIANVLLSVLCCLVAVWIGFAAPNTLARHFRS